MSTWTHERARVGALSRSRTPDDPDLVGARRDLAAARLEKHISEVVATWPTLTTEQWNRLATIIRGDAS